MGIEEALKNKDCEFVCLLNDDAYPNKYFIEDIISHAKKYKDYSAFSPLYVYNDTKVQAVGGGYFSEDAPCGEKQICHDVNPTKMSDKELLEFWDIISIPKQIDCGYGAAIVYRTSLFEKIGYLDPVFKHGFDEPDFAKRMKLKGEKILYLPTTVTHICGGSSKNRSFFKNLHIILPMNRGYLYFLMKHYPAEFVIKTELKKLKKSIKHPKGFLLEVYSILWNMVGANETRGNYHELYDPKDEFKTEIIGGVEKKIKIKQTRVPFKLRLCEFLLTYSFAICLLIVPCILYILGVR